MNIVEPIRELEKIDQLKEIFKQQSDRNYFLFLFGINTGLRISDILKLRVSDVRNKLHITITEKKTGKLKRFKLNASLQREIEIYTAGLSPETHLFKSREGKNKPIDRTTAYRILNQAARKLGLKHIGTHTLRKTFGYHFYQKTKDIVVLQMLFNHSSPRITLRYIGINQDIMDQAMESFSL